MPLISNPLVERVLGLALEVHKTLGPGLLEQTYQRFLAWEFTHAGLEFRREMGVPVTYKGVRVECGYRVDFLVEGWLVLEIKSIEKILRVHDAQVLTYLKLLGSPQGLLLNFNVPLLPMGIKSYLNTPPQ